jgi:hypothetical protein
MGLQAQAKTRWFHCLVEGTLYCPRDLPTPPSPPERRPRHAPPSLAALSAASSTHPPPSAAVSARSTRPLSSHFSSSPTLKWSRPFPGHGAVATLTLSPPISLTSTTPMPMPTPKLPQSGRSNPRILAGTDTRRLRSKPIFVPLNTVRTLTCSSASVCVNKAGTAGSRRARHQPRERHQLLPVRSGQGRAATRHHRARHCRSADDEGA